MNDAGESENGAEDAEGDAQHDPGPLGARQPAERGFADDLSQDLTEHAVVSL